MVRIRTLLVLSLFAAGCGGPATRLVTVDPGKGEGRVDFSVKNLTDVAINTFYMAKTERIDAAGGPELDPNTPEGDAAWGPDLLGRALVVGATEPIPVREGGRWDARAVDRDAREQLVTGLRLRPGGRYILELYEGGWRVFK